MFPRIDTDNPQVVEKHVYSIYCKLFPKSNGSFIANCFKWVTECFTGQFENYQAIDLRYHNYAHTLQVLVCMMDLLKNRHSAGDSPVLTEHMFELGLLAILLHDTGYLKTKDDTEGTGAKYTLIHVDRSRDFADLLLGAKGYSQSDIIAIQNMIRCTGVNVDLTTISFQNELEKIMGFILGTSDLVGQMSVDDYPAKLPYLYLEFAESFEHTRKFTNVAEVYSSAENLMENTHKFWGFYVKPKINVDFQKLYRFLSSPYPDGPNEYIERVEANVSSLNKKYGSGNP